jgi:hypothetical protein
VIYRSLYISREVSQAHQSLLIPPFPFSLLVGNRDRSREE